MASVSKVSTLTPVDSGNPFTYYPAAYLSPFSGAEKMAAVIDPVQQSADGSKGCTVQTLETSYLSTTLKIFTYIISLGIFPLLALLLTAAIRVCNQFYYIAEADHRRVEQIADNNLGDVPRNVPNLASNEPSPPEENRSPRIQVIEEQGARDLLNYEQAVTQAEAEHTAALKEYEQAVMQAEAQHAAQLRKSEEAAREADLVTTAGLSGELLFSKKFNCFDRNNYNVLRVARGENGKVQAAIISVSELCTLKRLYQHKEIEWRTTPTPENIQNPDNWFVKQAKVIFSEQK